MVVKRTESMIQRACLDWLRLFKKNNDVVFFRANSGAFKTAQGRYVKTGTPGLADICVVFNGTFYGVEVKTATGKMSEAQKRFKEDIEAAGGRYVLCRSVGDLKKTFDI
jgi:acetaldehyde dehydrogenase (acetylating)